jgi:DNA-binding NarL/FixJ family response regulator
MVTNTPNNKTIKILIADDHGIVRDGLKALLAKHDNFEVVGEASTGRQALELIERLRPSIVLMDLKMPNMDGIEASQRIKEKFPSIKILALAADMSPHTITRAINVGIAGLMLKESVFDELIDAINKVNEENNYFCPSVRNIATNDYIDWLQTGQRPKNSLMTDEESELIEVLAQGKSVGEIALHMNRSAKTIDARRRKIMNKLRLNSMVDLTKFAIRQGLATADS